MMLEPVLEYRYINSFKGVQCQSDIIDLEITSSCGPGQHSPGDSSTNSCIDSQQSPPNPHIFILVLSLSGGFTPSRHNLFSPVMMITW